MSMRHSLAVLTLGALPFAAACGGGGEQTQAPPATSAEAPAAATMGTATISGKVSYDGPDVPAEKIKTSADPKCQAMHKEGLEKKLVDTSGGGLAEAFVWIKSGVTGSYPAPAEPVLLDQHGCTYHPHLVGVRAGQPLTIRNSDDTLHNIHPRPTINAEFNVGQPRQGMESTKTFDKQEVMIPVGCDVHPWMRSYISVVNHPFFTVTKADGSYEIKGLPAGDYEVEVIHEKLKNLSEKVSVKDGEAHTGVDFTFKG